MFANLGQLGWRSTTRGYRCSHVRIPIPYIDDSWLELKNMRIAPYVVAEYLMKEEGEWVDWCCLDRTFNTFRLHNLYGGSRKPQHYHYD